MEQPHCVYHDIQIQEKLTWGIWHSIELGHIFNPEKVVHFKGKRRGQTTLRHFLEEEKYGNDLNFGHLILGYSTFKSGPVNYKRIECLGVFMLSMEEPN